MAKTKIDWCDEVWNPIVGCSRISAGCDNCYAARMAKRLNANPVTRGKYYHCYQWDGNVSFDHNTIDAPLHWRKPKRIFVNSMGDLFHENVPDEWIDRVFAVMAVSPIKHAFMVLTKRPERMQKYISGLRDRWAAFSSMACQLKEDADTWHDALLESGPIIDELWLGVSVEDQATADERIPLLLQTPAAHRFVSVEPMLGTVDLIKTIWNKVPESAITPFMKQFDKSTMSAPLLPGLDWVICGGENGPGARPMHPDWPRGLRDQCAAAGVPFFFKGWGEWLPVGQDESASGRGSLQPYDFWQVHRVKGSEYYKPGKKRSGHLLDGKEYRQFPLSSSGSGPYVR